jgi:hypothetical protein
MAIRFPVGATDVSHLPTTKTTPGTHPVSYSKGNEASFLADKAAGM